MSEKDKKIPSRCPNCDFILLKKGDYRACMMCGWKNYDPEEVNKKTVRIKSPRRYGERHLTEDELRKKKTDELYEANPSLHQLDAAIIKRSKDNAKKKTSN